MDLSSFLGEFRAEAVEHLQRLDERLLVLERDPTEVGPIRDMFISAHTIKGSSSMLGLEDVRAVAHALEDVLACLRDGGQALDRPTADLLFRAVDALRDLVAVASLPGSQLDPAGLELVAALQRRAAEEPEAPVVAGPSEVSPPGKPRVLLVEDSATVRMLESMLLSDAGFDVDAAENGPQALQLALSGRYCLVVAGLETPDLPGAELVAALRAAPTTRDVPVIVTSVSQSIGAQPRVVEPGREVHVPKGSLASHRLVEAAMALVPGGTNTQSAPASGGRRQPANGRTPK
jgi:chemotaxis protein histidine kinase CheA